MKTARWKLRKAVVQRATGPAQNAEYSTSGEWAGTLGEMPVLKTDIERRQTMAEVYFSIPESTLKEVISLLCKIAVNEVEYKDRQLDMANQALLNTRIFANQAERMLSRLYLPQNAMEQNGHIAQQAAGVN